MHPVLILFIIVLILSIVAIISYFIYKKISYETTKKKDSSLVNDTIEFLELYSPDRFTDPVVRNFEKLTPNERKSRLEELRKNK